MLNAAELKNLLDCDPSTGILRWRRSYNRSALAGMVAGHLKPNGYVCIRIRQKYYRVHRIVWLYEHGEWPSGDLDHINGDKSDNRISNLRVATASQNQANAKLSKRNVAGLKGVSEERGRWRARIKLHRKTINLGYFATALEAHSAYAEAARRYQGEFARLE
jgi:hypothetical protein